ncbi:MAG: hypothetical protein U0132_01245 [Gemmatimonadaceae bacterium]
MRRLVTALSIMLLALATPATAQQVTLDAVKVGDTTVVHSLRLRDGSTIVGRIVSVTADSVRVELRAGNLSLARTDVTEVHESSRSRMRNGVYWFDNPHATRLLFSPTAFPLEQGTGYFSDIYLFLAGAQWGITNRFSLGGGLSLFPTSNFSDNMFYLTPKVTVVDAPQLKMSLGGFLGWVGAAADEGESGSLGLLYGVASTGTRDNNLSLGLGWGYYGGNIADIPVIMLGGQRRISRRMSLISENWFVHDAGDTNGAISYGLRFLGERMSVDLAFINALGKDMIFPGVPFVGFAVKF